jgi:hypothetical protein
MKISKLMMPVLAVAMLAGVPACSSPAASGTPGAPAAVKFPFAVGKTWDYNVSTTTPDLPQPLAGTAKMELTKLQGTDATFKLTMKFPGVDDQTSEIKGSVAGNPYSSGSKQGSSTQETITVPAGTIQTTHEVYTETEGGKNDTNELWYNETNGLVKMKSTSNENGKTTVVTMELK